MVQGVGQQAIACIEHGYYGMVNRKQNENALSCS